MRAVLAALAILDATATAADPPPELATRGAEIYADNCLGCHGPTATEGEAGDIRGLGRATVTGAVRGGPGMMPTLPLTKGEIAAVAAYLAALSRQ